LAVWRNGSGQLNAGGGIRSEIDGEALQRTFDRSGGAPEICAGNRGGDDGGERERPPRRAATNGCSGGLLRGDFFGRRIVDGDASFADGLQPALRVFVETALEKAADGRRRVRGQIAEIRLILDYRGESFGDGLAGVHHLTGEHLDEEHAEGPDVGAAIDGL